MAHITPSGGAVVGGAVVGSAAPPVNGKVATSGTIAFGTGVAGDAAANEWTVAGNGTISWGPPGGPLDSNLYRSGVATVATDGDFRCAVIGKGLRVAEGANAKQGRAILGATGVIVVANTSVTAASEIFLTTQVPGGTPGAVYVSARTPGVSFTIQSSSTLDTSTVAFQIFEPA